MIKNFFKRLLAFPLWAFVRTAIGILGHFDEGIRALPRITALELFDEFSKAGDLSVIFRVWAALIFATFIITVTTILIFL